MSEVNDFKIDCSLIVMFFTKTDNCHVYFVFAYCVFFVYYVVCVFTTTISLVK